MTDAHETRPTGKGLNRQTFERWLADGESWIGVFENRDLSSHDIGRRVAFVYDVSQWSGAKEGETRAPDHKTIGLGWQYILIGKFRDVDNAIHTLTRGEIDAE